MSMVSAENISLFYGQQPLLESLVLTIHAKERLGLIGRNGSGKSTLLKILAKTVMPDSGVVKQAEVFSVLVPQLSHFEPAATVAQVFAQALAQRQSWESWQKEAATNEWVKAAGLSLADHVFNLSGGQQKRLSLASALATEPDILLLDEPTNHLDIQGIQWLEKILQGFQGAFLVVSHDRIFLENVVEDILELDRGQVRRFPGNFSQYQKRKQALLAEEAQQQALFDKFLAQEEAWIRQGVEARRTRNMGRVRRLEALRQERSRRREQQKTATLRLDTAGRSGTQVVVAENIFYQAPDGKVLVENFSTVIQRGNKVGFIGANGCGKTTLLKLLLGELSPTQGRVQLGTQVEIAYLDQMRSALDEEARVFEILQAEGGDFIEVQGQRLHIFAYLGQFLFTPLQARSRVKTLSGGERARLLLAKLFTKPANVLVFDEPTNDLDLETLTVLEDVLQEFSGTVLLVSHDRQFLDNIVTQSLVSLGNGQWREVAGGYSDWLRESALPLPSETVAVTKKSEKVIENANTVRSKTKLSYKESRELAELPQKIAQLEQRQHALEQALLDPKKQANHQELQKITQELEQVISDYEAAFLRWEVLEGKGS
jgi:ATP-binding cassette subfamily F protein uup